MDNSPSLGGQPKQPSTSDSPSLPFDRKQVQGLGKNQKLFMAWLYDQNRSVNWKEVLDWWADHLTQRYGRPIKPDIAQFNAMLGGLKSRGLIVASVHSLLDLSKVYDCAFVTDTFYGDRCIIERK